MSIDDPVALPPPARTSTIMSRLGATMASVAGDRRGLLLFVTSIGVLNGVTLVASALSLRWIDPALMGIWQTLLLASSYMTVVRLGVSSGLGRELPFAVGAGDTARATALASAASAYSALCSLLSGAAFLVALPFLWSAGPPWRLALPAMAIFSGTSLYLAFLQSTFRSDADFSKLTRIHFTQAGLGALLPLSAYAFGFAGLCVHAALQAILVTGMAHTIRPFRVAPRFDVPMLRQLAGIGLPLFAAGYLQTLAAGFDRVILLDRGGVRTVGYYTPALAVLAAMAVVPGALATYVYPRMSFALGQGHKTKTLRGMAFRAGALSLALSLPVALIGWALAPAATAAFFPKYTASIGAIRWSLFAGLFWSITPAAQVLGSLKAWRSLYSYVLLLVVARWAFPWFFSRVYEPLEGVAMGNMLAALLVGAVSLLLVRRETKEAAP